MDEIADQDEYNSDAPEFVSEEDAVEVPVDDNDVPMDDEEDDEDVSDGDLDENQTEMQKDIVEMATFVLKSHSDAVYAVSSYLDKKTSCLYVASGGGDDRAFLHKITKDEPPTTIPLSYSHKDSVSCVAFNNAYVTDDSHKALAVGSYDGTIVLYNPETGEQIQVLEGPTDVEWLCFHQKGGTVLLAGSAADGTVWMFHLPTGKCMQVFVGHEDAVNAGGFTPDGRFAVTASNDGSVRVWAPRSGACRHAFKLGDAPITCIGLGGGVDGQLIIGGAEDGTAHVCHISNKKVVAKLQHHESGAETNNDTAFSVEAVAFAPSQVNPSWCATGSVDGSIKIWDLTHGVSCRQKISLTDTNGQPAGVTRIVWHSSTPSVFASTTEGEVHLLDARDGTLINQWSGHSKVINDLSVEFLEVGQQIIITGADDNEVRVYR